MRRFISLLTAAVLAAPIAAAAQVVRVERPSDAWLREAPRVRVWLENRALGGGAPALVNLELSDDAYVVVGRVERTGRLTILYPQGPTRRSHLAGGMVHRIRGRFQSNAAFFATDWGRGFVFAIASYTPLDLTGFELRDFRPGWTSSTFTLASRTLAPDPDEYVTAFAAAVLWKASDPYDYDVDFYNSAFEGSAFASAFALCNPELRFYLRDAGLAADQLGFGLGFGSGLGYSSACRSYYFQLQCLGWSALWYSPYGGSCFRYAPARRYYTQAPIPTDSAAGDTAARPNERVIRNGLWRPDTATRNAEPAAYDELFVARTEKDEANRWDRLFALPEGARQKLKGDDEDGASATFRTTRAGGETIPLVKTVRRSGPERSKPTRAAPTREATRVDAAPPTRDRYSDRVRRTTTSSKPSRTSSSRPSTRSRPASSSAPQIRVTKPASSKPKSTKPTSSGSSKTKPPK